MARISAQLAGVQLYFDDLGKAKTFYGETLGLKLADEQPGHHAKFEGWRWVRLSGEDKE